MPNEPTYGFGLPAATIVFNHPSPEETGLMTYYAGVVAVEPGWYVQRQGGCLVNFSGPFETEQVAQTHAATITAQAEEAAQTRRQDRARRRAQPRPEPKLAPEQASGWECPKHWLDDIRQLTSWKGREYRSCAACEEFEGRQVRPSAAAPVPFPRIYPKHPEPSVAPRPAATFWDTFAGSLTLWLIILGIPVLLTFLNLWAHHHRGRRVGS